MSKYLLITLIFVLGFTTLFGQSEAQLISQLEKAPIENKVKILNQLSKVVLKTNPTTSLEYALEALDKSGDNISEKAVANINIGKAYAHLDQPKKAIKFYKEAENIYHNNNILTGEAYCKRQIANSYLALKDQKKAIEYYEKSYSIYHRNNKHNKTANLAHDLVELYVTKNDLANTKLWTNKATKAYKKANKKSDAAKVIETYAAALADFGDYNEAIKQIEKAKELAKDNSTLLKEINETFKTIEHNNREEAEAVTTFKKEQDTLIKQHIKTIETKNVLSLAQIKKLSYENQVIELERLIEKENYEKDLLAKKNLLEIQEKNLLLKDAEITIKNAEIQQQIIEKRQRTLQLIGAIIGLFFISLIAFISYRNYKNKKKAYQELNLKNEKIKLQKTEIEYKSKSIEKSIQYAKKIQTSVLPYQEALNRINNSSFALFKPKDQVSGDFIWTHTFDNKSILAVADCTGHGVPGAFISIICANILEKVIVEEKITQPNLILDKVDQLLKQTINKSNTESLNDGMDIALILIDDKEIYFAGARNSIIIYSNKKTTTYKGDRKSIGYGMGVNQIKEFNITNISLEKGDLIYLFSDGIVDQKGGLENQKFYSKRLKDFILENNQEPLHNQKEIIEEIITEWKKDEEQMDDITLVGIQV